MTSLFNFNYLSKLVLNMMEVFKKNIRYKIFTIYLIVITVPIIFFGLFSYKMSSNVISSDYKKYRDRINTQIVENIDENIKSLERQSMGIYANLDDVVNVISTPASNINTDYLEMMAKVKKYLNSIIQGNNNINGISLISLNGEIKLYLNRDSNYLKQNSVYGQPWFGEAIKSTGNSILLGPHYNEFNTKNTNNRKSVISVLRAIIDLNTDEVCGVLLIDQDIDYFSGMLSKVEMEPGEIITIFSEKGEIIYTNKDLSTNNYEKIHTYIQNPNKGLQGFSLNDIPMLISFKQSSNSDWRVVSLQPISNLEKKSLFLKNINITLLIVLAICTFIISVLISYLITKPLLKLTESIKEVQNGDFNTSVAVNGKDELAQIGKSFNKMVDSIKTLIEQKYQLGILCKQAELEALQSQINPHFLFNTLNSIKVIIDKRDHLKASVMVLDLSDIFRYCLNKGEYIVKFADELEHIKKYLHLQNCRFSDRYEVLFDIDTNVLNYYIPRLTLQPIVENAIYHGLERKVEKGKLVIAAQAVNGKFYIYISDNGLGIPEQELIEINTLMEKNPENQNKSAIDKLGIFNVNARIKLNFGNEYGISIFSTLGKKTTVKITLPA